MRSVRLLLEPELDRGAPQVETDVPTTSSSVAMLIRGQKGDWGILTGNWVGYRVGIPPDRKNRTNAVHGHPGQLHATFTPLGTCSLEKMTLENSKGNMHMPGLNVDLKNGTVQLKNHAELPEKLALCISLSIMQVLLQPRPKPEVEPKSNSRQVVPLDGSKYLMLRAAGYDVPCTHGSLSVNGGVHSKSAACGGCGGCGTTFQKRLVHAVSGG